MTVVVIFDEDRTFGEVEYVPRPRATHVRKVIVSTQMTAHLEGEGSAAIRKAFEHYSGLFDDQPGVADVGEHKIVLEGVFNPGAGNHYRVPASL